MEKRNDAASDYIWLLKVRNKALENRILSFENGHAYQLLLNYVNHVTLKKDSEVRAIKRELAASHNETVSSRKAWSQIFDDLDKEHNKQIKKLESEIRRRDNRILQLEQQCTIAKDKEAEWRKKYYELSEKIEEVEGLNKKLTAQVNKDFQNSSIPSSKQGAGRKKIPNGREKTGRRRGGQPGHKGHRLTQLTPTESHHLPDPKKFTNNPEYYPTGNTVKRQKIVLLIGVKIVEYTATEYRSRITGSRFHAEFPSGYDTDISYDSSVKAFAFLLANEGNMAAGKIREILREASKGKIDISEATINGLAKEFSLKSPEEKQKIIESVMESPALNIDFTNANVDGNSKQVLIIASPSKNSTLFMGRDNKGHKGIAGTPVEDYVGVLVHDHDTTFYSYGTGHQECMQHNIRYLIGSIENEPERKWNKKMLKAIRDFLHYWNKLGEDAPEQGKISEFKKTYDEILEEAKKEYENEPPSDYYRDGYNLYLRLEKYKDSQLKFLEDKNIPHNNSLAERKARLYKRKQNQVMAFRSSENFAYICDALSVIDTMRQEEDYDIYENVKMIFSRKRH